MQEVAIQSLTNGTLLCELLAYRTILFQGASLLVSLLACKTPCKLVCHLCSVLLGITLFDGTPTLLLSFFACIEEWCMNERQNCKRYGCRSECVSEIYLLFPQGGLG